MRGRPAGRTVVVTLTLLGALLVAARPASADVHITFFHFNACGNVCNHGSNGAVVDAIRDAILDLRPHAVSVNEVCRSQFRALQRHLDRGGYAMRGRWVLTNATDHDCDGHRFGNGVLVRGEVLRSRSWALPFPEDETRKLVCVATRFGGRRTDVCSTHITNGKHKNAQVRRVARIVTPWVRAGRPVVVMGDFNVTPTDDRLDRLYVESLGLGADGVFQEADAGHGEGRPCRCGESTHDSGRKLDYIFLSAPQWRWVSADATTSDHSDHDPIHGWATLRTD